MKCIKITTTHSSENAKRFAEYLAKQLKQERKAA